jgi:hypothetical protein
VHHRKQAGSQGTCRRSIERLQANAGDDQKEWRARYHVQGFEDDEQIGHSVVSASFAFLGRCQQLSASCVDCRCDVTRDQHGHLPYRRHGRRIDTVCDE